MEGSLEGLTVVALEQAVAAPLCTMRLAEAGARVIKIERAEGDFARHYDNVVHGESAYFVWLNRGKQSLVLDLKSREDCALLGRMIAASDVFVQNLAPGAAARAGFGSAKLRAANPRLITCDISGYGEDGPYRDMKAYDLLVQCESGLASITGTPDGPGRVGVSAADICCGMNAYAAILEALFVRERTGVGSGIAVSLFDGLADWMTVPLLHFDYSGKAPSRVGLAHPSIAPYGEFPVAGERSIVLAVQNEREWRAFCSALGLEAMADDPRFCSNVQRVANRGDLDREIGAALADRDTKAVASLLKAAGIAFGLVNDVSGLSAHPQLRRVSVLAPSGAVQMPALPVRWDNRENAQGAVPELDSHGAEIRREFA
ncbi:MAG: CaiB/BaiF CoA-transferase family protein [Sphingobium sp.]|nr:CoA transferase [Sphingomonas sp.]